MAYIHPKQSINEINFFKMKTAVEWLEEKIAEYGRITPELFYFAKEMENKQIKDAYYTGNDDFKDKPDREAEQYYNETFKQT